MVTQRKKYDDFDDLPKSIQDFLLNKAEVVYDGLIRDFNLPVNDFFDLIEAPVLNAVLGWGTVTNAITEINVNLKKIGKADLEVKKILDLLIEKVFWPLRTLFEQELFVEIRKRGLLTSQWSQEMILFKPLSYTGVVSKIISHLQVVNIDKKIRDNLKSIVRDFATQVIDTEMLKSVLQKSVNFGGCGFSADLADQVVNFLIKLSKTVDFLSDEEYNDFLNKKVEDIHTLREDEQQEEQEIETLKKQSLPKPKELTVVDKAIESTLESIDYKKIDSYLQRRLKSIVSSRLRGVRSRVGVIKLLRRDTKVGGLGLNLDDATEMSQKIEDKYTEFKKTIEDFERKRLDLQILEQKRKIEQRRKLEAEEHAKWYEEKVKKINNQKTKTTDIALKLKKVLKERSKEDSNNSINDSNFGSMVEVDKAMTDNVKKLNKEKQEIDKAFNKIRVSANTIELTNNQMSKNKVDGVLVKKTTHLQGLMGELALMDLAHFRRLGTESVQIEKKIMSIFDLLEQQSLTKKMKAIDVWRNSPIMKLYYSLVNESFKSQKPILEIIKQKQQAGENTLTESELGIIINLNNKLHF